MTIALFGISSIYNGIQKFMSAMAHLERTEPFTHAQSSSIANKPNANMLAKQRALRVHRVSEQGEAPHCRTRQAGRSRSPEKAHVNPLTFLTLGGAKFHRLPQ